MSSTRRDILLAGLGLVAAGPAWAAEALAADCRREAGGLVRLDWTGPAADVHVGLSADGPFDQLVARGAAGSWSGQAPVSPRPYFRLAGGGAATETAERVLPLQGGRNFRDLGGYRTADGRMVRWGRLYRSGVMSGLTDADYAYLDRLGVQVICDFRANAERAAAPTRWSGPAMYTRDYDMDLAAFGGTSASGPPTAEAMRARMMRSYETTAYEHAELYRRMFAELVSGHTPLAFNCTGGKDRTGVAAGLILTALGVPRDQIVADYALTEKILNVEAMLSGGGTATTAPAGYEAILRMPAEVRLPLMRSDPAYLQSMFAALDTREGSVEAFLDKRLGVGPAEIKILRDSLLKTV